VIELDLGWLIAFGDREQVALAPHVVAFPVHVLARCLALLPAQPSLMLADPIELRGREGTNGVYAHAPRCRDAHAARRWIDAQVDVLDVFEDDVDGDVVEGDPGGDQGDTSLALWRSSNVRGQRS